MKKKGGGERKKEEGERGQLLWVIQNLRADQEELQMT